MFWACILKQNKSSTVWAMQSGFNATKIGKKQRMAFGSSRHARRGIGMYEGNLKTHCQEAFVCKTYTHDFLYKNTQKIYFSDRCQRQKFSWSWLDNTFRHTSFLFSSLQLDASCISGKIKRKRKLIASSVFPVVSVARSAFWQHLAVTVARSIRGKTVTVTYPKN